MINATFDLIVAVVVGVILGNLMADQATIKDCATKNEAKMFGGGAVVCEVKKEVK